MSAELRAVQVSTHLGMDELHELVKAHPLPGGSYRLSLAEDLTEHLVWMRMSERGERTLFCRRRAVCMFAEWLGSDPRGAAADELYAYQLHLARRSRNNASWTMALLRPYYAWLHKMGRRGDDPCVLLPVGSNGRRGVPRPMPEADVERMISTAPRRLLPWLILAAWCGLRACEIARLRVEDLVIGLGGQPIVCVRGKGEVYRNVAVPHWAWPIITADLPAGGPCFRRLRGFGGVSPKIVSKESNKYLRRIGIKHTLHALRHRAATVLLRQPDADIRTVQDFLGHALLSTTQIYTQVDNEQMAAAINSMPAPPVLPAEFAGLMPHRPDGTGLRLVDTAPGGTA